MSYRIFNIKSYKFENRIRTNCYVFSNEWKTFNFDNYAQVARFRKMLPSRVTGVSVFSPKILPWLLFTFHRLNTLVRFQSLQVCRHFCDFWKVIWNEYRIYVACQNCHEFQSKTALRCDLQQTDAFTFWTSSSGCPSWSSLCLACTLTRNLRRLTRGSSTSM